MPEHCEFCGLLDPGPEHRAHAPLLCDEDACRVIDALRHAARDYGETADALKDLADALGANIITVTVPRGSDHWDTITVAHASLYSDSPDGWDVTVQHGSL